MMILTHPDDDMLLSLHRVKREEIDKLIPNLTWVDGWAKIKIGKIEMQFYYERGDGGKDEI